MRGSLIAGTSKHDSDHTADKHAFVQFRAHLKDVQKPGFLGAGDYLVMAPVAEGNEVWAVTVVEGNFAVNPALPEGPRIMLTNTTLWSAPSFERAQTYIQHARKQAGLIWVDTRRLPVPSTKKNSRLGLTIAICFTVSLVALCVLPCHACII
jgi:hypothetical protein